MSDFDTEIKNEFINEALLNLEESEDSFMELENAADAKPLLDKIFRVAHNLKGGARAVGFGQVAEFTHELENLVQKLQKGEVSLNSDVVSGLLRANDRLVEMLTALKANLDAQFESEDILTEIRALQHGATPPSPEDHEPPPPPAQEFFSEPQPQPQLEARSELQPVQLEPMLSKAGTKGREDEVIRVNLSRIDRLNDYVGELIVLLSVMRQQSTEDDPSKVQATLRQMIKLSKDVQGLSMSLRMLPVKPLIQKLQRVVRDTGKALGKKVELVLSGDQIDIDKSVLDRLADPLIHILRNAVDHGLETSEQRTGAGKPATGHVSLKFFNEGNHLIVEVQDDGKGIDAEVIRKRAVDRKLIQENQALTEKQLIHLIFHPGFSTKAEASEISGRGVGMDVVKTNVEKIGGQVDVQTAPGKGSLFRIQIPLSLAVIEGLVVRTDNNRFVIPLNQVQETVNLKSHRVFANRPGTGNCFDLRGTVVPLYSTEEALGAGRTSVDMDGTALIVNIDDRPMGLVVKHIVQAQQIVIKPLGNGIIPQRGWLGSCVLGDGLPTLILSPVELLSGKVSYKFSDSVQGGTA